MGPKPRASFPSSRGLSPLIPSSGAALGLRRVLEGVQGPRVAEPGRPESGLGKRGRRCARARAAGGREGRCPAAPEQATVRFSGSSAPGRAGAQALRTGLKACFLSGNGAAVPQRLRLLPICLMWTVMFCYCLVKSWLFQVRASGLISEFILPLIPHPFHV